MIRKTTWIVLVVFILLLAGVVILQRVQGNVTLVKEEVTPSATSAPLLLGNLQAQDIVAIDWTGEGQTITLTKAADGSWSLGPGTNGPVEAGQVEQLRASLVSLHAASQLGASNPLDAIGLSVPTNIISLRTTSGQLTQINLGSVTPTGSGYYVQVDSNAPVVVDKYAIDSVLDLLKPTSWVTPTPLPETPAVQATATP